MKIRVSPKRQTSVNYCFLFLFLLQQAKIYFSEIIYDKQVLMLNIKK